MTSLAANAGDQHDSLDGAMPRRWPRLRAYLFDVAALALAEVAALLATVVWLVARTDRGRFDVGDADGALALALTAAVVPAWLAWVALSAVEGATPGQARAGITVVAQRLRERALRLALDPRGVIGWWWLAGLLFLGEVPLLSWLALLAAVIVTLAVLASAGLWLVQPSTLPIHDRVARTRLEQR